LLVVYSLLTERKTKQLKTYASYRLVGLGYYIITGKIITSSNSLITKQFVEEFFSNLWYYYFITGSGKILKLFDSVRKF